MRASLGTSIALCLCAVLPSCRDASGGGSGALVIVPNPHGANGCSGPDQAFVPPQTPTAIVTTVLVIGPDSQVTSAATGEVLYATGVDGSVVMLDVSVDPPAEVEIVPAGSGTGTVAELLTDAGIAAPPRLSGLAVLDAQRLVVVEGTSNTLITIDRTTSELAFYAGQPNETPGFADGLAQGAAQLARFSFGAPTQICPTGDVPPRVFVADTGNHALRLVSADLGGVLQVSTVAGNGTPGFALGSTIEPIDLTESLFETPSGLSAACSGALIVSERGGSLYGQRVRQLEIGQPSFFGGFLGTSTTLAGNGTDETTQGSGEAAHVSQPVSPLVTEDGEIYWVDSGTGVLRRMSLDGIADCPLTADCAVASFPAGHACSLTQTPAGILFVMDATDGILYRVTP